jgi:hypothetical protein
VATTAHTEFANLINKQFDAHYQLDSMEAEDVARVIAQLQLKATSGNTIRELLTF